MELRRELHRRGLRYRLDQAIVPGAKRRRVDIVFPRAKLAVFVDGCFWHGCPDHGARRHDVNGWYWPEKISGNRRRDADTDERLRAAGWTVLRVWEHEDPLAAAQLVGELARTEVLRAALVPDATLPAEPGVGRTEPAAAPDLHDARPPADKAG